VVTGRFVEGGYNLMVRRGFPELFEALSKEHEKHRERSFCEVSPGVYGGNGFDRADIPGPRVGVEPFKEKKGWNETELADLRLGKAITWAVRSRLVQGAATPVSIPSDTLRRFYPGYEESSAKMSDEEYEVIEGLDYALSGAVEKLAVSEAEATLSVTYQVFRKTREKQGGDRLALVAKRTLRRSQRPGASKRWGHPDDASLAAINELVGEVAEAITKEVCPTVIKHALAAVRG